MNTWFTAFLPCSKSYVYRKVWCPGVMVVAMGSCDSLIVLTSFVASQMNHWGIFTLGQIIIFHQYEKNTLLDAFLGDVTKTSAELIHLMTLLTKSWNIFTNKFQHAPRSKTSWWLNHLSKTYATIKLDEHFPQKIAVNIKTYLKPIPIPIGSFTLLKSNISHPWKRKILRIDRSQWGVSYLTTIKFLKASR